MAVIDGVDGGVAMVTTTSALEVPQTGSVSVQRRVIGPLPPVCVKVALGVLTFGLKVPVPPPTTVHTPEPTGVFPPNPAVVPLVQMVCGPPTVATCGTVKLRHQPLAMLSGCPPATS